MFHIEKTGKIHANRDRVWSVISDLDREKDYWDTIRDVRLLRTEDNTVVREVTVGPESFPSRSLQTMKFEPTKRISLSIDGDRMTGQRTIDLATLENGDTAVNISWSMEPKQVPGFVPGLMKDHLSILTELAIMKIAREAESIQKE